MTIKQEHEIWCNIAIVLKLLFHLYLLLKVVDLVQMNEIVLRVVLFWAIFTSFFAMLF